MGGVVGWTGRGSRGHRSGSTSWRPRSGQDKPRTHEARHVPLASCFPPRRSGERFWEGLLGAELPERTQPIFDVVSSRYLAVSDGLNIDGHDLEALAGMGHAKQVASGCSSHLAAHDYTVPGDQDFLDLKPHVGDGLGKASDHLDRCITAPAFTRQIAPARLVVRREDLFLQGFHIALDGLVEQAVPWRNGGARLCLGQALSRCGASGGQQTGGDYEMSEFFHASPPWVEGSTSPVRVRARFIQFDPLADSADRTGLVLSLQRHIEGPNQGLDCITRVQSTRFDGFQRSLTKHFAKHWQSTL